MREAERSAEEARARAAQRRLPRLRRQLVEFGPWVLVAMFSLLGFVAFAMFETELDPDSSSYDRSDWLLAVLGGIALDWVVVEPLAMLRHEHEYERQQQYWAQTRRWAKDEARGRRSARRTVLRDRRARRRGLETSYEKAAREEMEERAHAIAARGPPRPGSPAAMAAAGGAADDGDGGRLEAVVVAGFAEGEQAESEAESDSSSILGKYSDDPYYSGDGAYYYSDDSYYGYSDGDDYYGDDYYGDDYYGDDYFRGGYSGYGGYGSDYSGYTGLYSACGAASQGAASDAGYSDGGGGSAPRSAGRGRAKERTGRHSAVGVLQEEGYTDRGGSEGGYSKPAASAYSGYSGGNSMFSTGRSTRSGDSMFSAGGSSYSAGGGTSTGDCAEEYESKSRPESLRDARRASARPAEVDIGGDCRTESAVQSDAPSSPGLRA